MKKLFVIYHGRFPSEKAAALFAAKEADSFVPFGAVTLLVPRNLGRVRSNPHAYYNISTDVRVVYLPALDLRYVPLVRHAAFLISYATFTLSCLAYFALQVRGRDIVITNEPLPALMATLFSDKVVVEVHDFPTHHHNFYARLFRRAYTVLATNKWKKGELQKKFDIPEHKLLLERNAVDIEQFSSTDHATARAKLSLPQEVHIVVYTGHLYVWKGVDTLAEAAQRMPEVAVYFVGGTEYDLQKFKKKYASISNIHAVGQKPHGEMPLWQSAADVLVLPNSARDQQSAQYTSPMKLFEYMASGRPIVASNVPSIAEVLPVDAGYLVEPDSAAALAAAIQQVFAEPAEVAAKAARAQTLVRTHSWSERAKRLTARFA